MNEEKCSPDNCQPTVTKETAWRQSRCRQSKQKGTRYSHRAHTTMCLPAPCEVIISLLFAPPRVKYTWRGPGRRQEASCQVWASEAGLPSQNLAFKCWNVSSVCGVPWKCLLLMDSKKGKKPETVPESQFIPPHTPSIFSQFWPNVPFFFTAE